MKKFSWLLICLLLMVWTSCEDLGVSPNNGSKNSDLTISADKTKGKVGIMSPVALSCASGSTQVAVPVTVTGGATGAPAGFSLQWIAQDVLDANGGVWPLDGYCKASFSGNANGYYYSLGAGQSVTVMIGEILFDNPGASTAAGCNDGLECGTQYAFRAFAHATSSLVRSDWSYSSCSTLDCRNDDGCTYTQGFWKTHGSAGKASEKAYDSDGNFIGYISVWPVSTLTIGNITYKEGELQSIFDKPAAGNGLITLAHQLIAAKLNVANGSNSTDVEDAISAADALIGNLIVPPVGTGFLSPSSTSSLVELLAKYNEGATGPGHCN